MSLSARVATVLALLALVSCERDGPRFDSTDGARPGDARADDGVGMCAPEALRCRPTASDTPERCDDHGQWVAGAACGTAPGARCEAGTCVDACADAARDRGYLGCEYYAVSLANALGPLWSNGQGADIDALTFAVVVANPQSVAVTVVVDGGALSEPRIARVAPGALAVLALPWVTDLASPPFVSRLRRGGAYRVRSDAPIAAYQYNPFEYARDGRYSYSSDASLLLPLGVLGTRYAAVSVPDWVLVRGADAAPLSGTLAVVGVGPGSTRVTVVIPRDDVAGGPGVAPLAQGHAATFDLARGDVLQLLGDGHGDISGATVQADQPVAVFSGHVCAQVPIGRLACDHLEEQLVPEAAWGRRHVLAGFADRPWLPVLARVVAQRDATLVTFTPAASRPSIRLDRYQVVEFEAPSGTVLDSSAPVLVAELMTGQGSESVGAGDPSLVLATPLEQYRRDYAFVTPESYPQNYANIVAPADAPPALDGVVIRGTMMTALSGGAQGMALWRLPITAGPHTLRASRPEDRVGLTVYGVAPYTSYALPGGFDVRTLTPP